MNILLSSLFQFNSSHIPNAHKCFSFSDRFKVYVKTVVESIPPAKELHGSASPYSSHKSHVYFPLLRSFQRMRPRPISCMTFRNPLIFLRRGVILRPRHKLKDHPLSAIHSCLFRTYWTYPQYMEAFWSSGPKVEVSWLTLELRILDVLGSNINPNTRYSDWVFLAVSFSYFR
jgi:hypothetical protein